jgi:hypothetical protein
MQNKDTNELFEDIELLVVATGAALGSELFDLGFFGMMGILVAYQVFKGLKWLAKVEKEEEVRFIVQQILENKEV